LAIAAATIVPCFRDFDLRSEASIGARFAKSFCTRKSGGIPESAGAKFLVTVNRTAGKSMSTAMTDGKLSDQTIVDAPSCPHCASPYIKRVRRATTYERLISLLYVYPFSCQLCGHWFKLFRPGVRYVRVDEDQREYQRMRVDLPTTLLEGTLTCDGSAIDVSMRGCTVKTAAPLLLGGIVKARLRLPNDEDPVMVEAAIRNRSHDRIGLEFLRFRGEDRQRLRHFMQGLLASQSH
jgi:hypothetical protein